MFLLFLLLGIALSETECHESSAEIPRHNSDRTHVNISDPRGQIWGTHRGM